MKGPAPGENHVRVYQVSLSEEMSDTPGPLDYRALLLCIFHNRVLRLHRKCRRIDLFDPTFLHTLSHILGPFFLRGFQDKAYEPSYLACLRSASEICAGFRRMEGVYLEHVRKFATSWKVHHDNSGKT